MGQVSILVGAQWGDEGKGKWCDVLAEEHDVVARFQGGNNAGHTIFIKDQKIVLHQIPSGIFSSHTVSILSAGVVVNPAELAKEITKIATYRKIYPKDLLISQRAHIISPWHQWVDALVETSSKKPIGTTKRGIGPSYSDKTNRRGLRVGAYISQEERFLWLETMRKLEPSFEESLNVQKQEWEAFHAAADFLAPFVNDADDTLRTLIYQDKKVLLEGAQGALLDINFGTYPFVTSSNTTSGGAIANVGFDPRQVKSILGIAKAYVTRVGAGPFPTELKDALGQELREKGQEYGATTQRPRRCGWLDIVALRYSVQVNGIDGLFLNKLDILTGLKELKIATAYKHPTRGILKVFPSEIHVLEECEPIYETFPGWQQEFPKGGTFSDLPMEAQNYVRAVERLAECRIIKIGTGPKKADFITC